MKEDNKQVENLNNNNLVAPAPQKKPSTDNNDSVQQLLVAPENTQKEPQHQSLPNDELKEKLDEQQNTLKSIQETLQKMSTYKPPEEKKQDKKKPKFKIWSGFLKDITKTALKFGGGIIALCAVLGFFPVGMLVVMSIIGLSLLMFTDPIFEIFDDYIIPNVKKGLEPVFNHFKNFTAYRLERKQVRKEKRMARKALRIERKQNKNNQTSTANVEKTSQSAENLNDNKPQQAQNVEQTPAVEKKAEVELKPVENIVETKAPVEEVKLENNNNQDNNKPQTTVAQEMPKVEIKPENKLSSKKDLPKENAKPQQNAKKHDVQTKLFMKSKLNPMFVVNRTNNKEKTPTL